MQDLLNSIKVVDSHTEGEPTRVVIGGGPDLGQGSLAERMAVLESEFDPFRRTVVLEPRGFEAMVGALLCAPDDPSCETAILFFNNHGYLKMCGHGTIGVAATLAYLNRLTPGEYRFQTPAGIIEVGLHDNHRVSFTNVSSFVLCRGVTVDAGEYGNLTGDIAYGGNWFFITQSPLDLVGVNRKKLLGLAARIRQELLALQFEGVDSECIDHVQFVNVELEQRYSKNFVVCPGNEFDRSPCGTGTSALIASLAEKGELSPGESWTQESLTGGKFYGTYHWAPGKSKAVIPTITGEAFVCAEGSLIQHREDPYRFGNLIGDER